MRLIVTYWYRPWWGLGLIWRERELVLTHDNPDLEQMWDLVRQFREAGADVRVEDP